VRDVSRYRLFVQADCRDKVSDAPYTAVDVYLAYKLKPLFDSDARFDLELLHDGRYGEVRGYFDLEVNMIVIGIEGVYIQRRILPYYSVTGGDELFFNVFFQPFLSVASSPDEVILNLICTVV
jgi:hypothetical protein